MRITSSLIRDVTHSIQLDAYSVGDYTFDLIVLKKGINLHGLSYFLIKRNKYDYSTRRLLDGVDALKVFDMYKICCKLIRKGDRVVYCGGLENRCTERYRRFESYPFRNEIEGN